jgi:hypothetical protein
MTAPMDEIIETFRRLRPTPSCACSFLRGRRPGLQRRRLNCSNERPANAEATGRTDPFGAKCLERRGAAFTVALEQAAARWACKSAPLPTLQATVAGMQLAQAGAFWKSGRSGTSASCYRSRACFLRRFPLLAGAGPIGNGRTPRHREQCRECVATGNAIGNCRGGRTLGGSCPPHQSVIAPRLALETSFTYFARTPVA